jgi:hypothetical protein
MQASINQSFRTKIKVAAILNNTTVEKMFSEALNLLFDKYDDIINGVGTQEIQVPLMNSESKVDMNLPIDEIDLESLETLSKKTSLSKSHFCNIAIYLLLQQLELE